MYKRCSRDMPFTREPARSTPRVRLDQIEDGMVLLRWALGLLDLLAYMLTRCADEQV